jgi:uncharacterized protein (TIGR00255 family)
MTGYGRAEQAINGKFFLVELRSLNGKQYDIKLQLPALLKPYEFEIRNLLNEQLIRGSVECSITIKQNGAAKPVSINTELIKAYYESLSRLSAEMSLPMDNVLSAILKLPEVVVASNEVLPEQEWEAFRKLLLEAAGQLTQHRKEEGRVLEEDIANRIEAIERQQTLVAALEPARREKIKEGLVKVLEENVGKDSYDPNRLEQELIYYIEKIDISEEQVRLKNHCDYFRDILRQQELSKGKKLSFVLQEIGREINTTGSKAYDAEVQKCVILMKDELEKAKEQILNVL